ncbi:MAG: hypothetical protein IT307_13080 [Chloroflexi bacterium]|nr:hypothetical protein [Chloroflexota bacterium]
MAITERRMRLEQRLRLPEQRVQQAGCALSVVRGARRSSRVLVDPGAESSRSSATTAAHAADVVRTSSNSETPLPGLQLSVAERFGLPTAEPELFSER